MRLPACHFSRCASHARGFVLIVCLLMLVVMSVLSVAIYRSFTLQESLAGNTREKQRALEAAESALQRAETWLESYAAAGKLGTRTGSPCTGNSVRNGADDTKVQICSTPLVNPVNVPWTFRFDFTPAGMQVNASGIGGIDATTKDVKYLKQPSFYIQSIGVSSTGDYLYRIHAVGYGGSESAVAVLESVYQIP